MMYIQWNERKNMITALQHIILPAQTYVKNNMRYITARNTFGTMHTQTLSKILLHNE